MKTLNLILIVTQICMATTAFIIFKSMEEELNSSKEKYYQEQQKVIRVYNTSKQSVLDFKLYLMSTNCSNHLMQSDVDSATISLIDNIKAELIFNQNGNRKEN